MKTGMKTGMFPMKHPQVPKAKTKTWEEQFGLLNFIIF